MDFAIAVILALAFVLAELFARHRAEPGRAIFSLPGLAYLLLHGVAAALGLVLLRWFEVKFGLTTKTEAETLRWVRILVAAVGAMAVLRSALLVVRYGPADVPLGPLAVVQMFLTAIDREAARQSTSHRIDAVSRIMRGISFEKAVESLPAVCLALAPDAPSASRDLLNKQIAEAKQGDMADEARALVLGLALAHGVGEDVLRTAVENLGAKITA